MTFEDKNEFRDGFGTKDTSFWDFKGELDFVDKWFLMSSPVPVFLISMSYLLFVMKIGPDFMKNRKPYQLTNILLVYNVFQVILSAYMFYRCMILQIPLGLIHKTCNMETEEARRQITSLHYVYFISKLTELLDTVFFVFRKKQSQITFLHVYHHFFMACCAWAGLKYEPGYSVLLIGTINCFVHTIMYTYYGLSAFPSLAKYLWWKKYITRLQLFQFFLVLIHFSVNLKWSECKQSKTLINTMIVNLALFIYLFAKFYVDEYLKKQKNETNHSVVIKNGVENGLKRNNSENLEAKYNKSRNEENKTNKKRIRSLGENVQK